LCGGAHYTREAVEKQGRGIQPVKTR